MPVISIYYKANVTVFFNILEILEYRAAPPQYNFV